MDASILQSFHANLPELDFDIRFSKRNYIYV